MRLEPVRLCDLPRSVRITAARALARETRDPDERADLLIAALYPSERVYWVATRTHAIDCDLDCDCTCGADT